MVISLIGLVIFMSHRKVCRKMVLARFGALFVVTMVVLFLLTNHPFPRRPQSSKCMDVGCCHREWPTMPLISSSPSICCRRHCWLSPHCRLESVVPPSSMLTWSTRAVIDCRHSLPWWQADAGCRSAGRCRCRYKTNAKRYLLNHPLWTIRGRLLIRGYITVQRTAIGLGESFFGFN